jgi:L-alanine-DL-glutamate epimerase-like enolase superfamily enzyme
MKFPLAFSSSPSRVDVRHEGAAATSPKTPSNMNRRDFFSICSGAAASALLPRWSWASDLPRDVKITRILGFDLESRRCKVCGKNSRLGVHGDRARDPMVRIFTNAGIEGLGNCRASEAVLGSLLGKNPFDFFKANEPAFHSPVGAGSMPLWDLAGKVLQQPVFKLLGGKGPQRVPVYDGSIYFADLLPEYAGRWRDRFKEEIDLGFKRGHRAFKIKVGRGAKWMPTEEGFDRDLMVVKLIREHTGPETLLAADANNGYDLARAKRFLTELPGVNLAFVEELFNEEVALDLELKAFLREHKLKTLIADGETQQTLEPFKPFIAARAIDIYEGDINHFGIEGIMTEAAWAKAEDLQVSPHGWGSLVGFYMTLHVGRALTNYYRAENDPLDNNLLIAEGYAINDGTSTVPDAAGFGLKLDEQQFAAAVKPKFDLKL